MYTDAIGNTHFEFWQGLRIDGRTFQTLPLFRLCQEFGDAQVKEACHHLGCLPYTADLATIKEECQRIENLYV